MLRDVFASPYRFMGRKTDLSELNTTGGVCAMTKCLCTESKCLRTGAGRREHRTKSPAFHAQISKPALYLTRAFALSKIPCLFSMHKYILRLTRCGMFT